jgi:hypothetical protein
MILAFFIGFAFFILSGKLFSDESAGQKKNKSAKLIFVHHSCGENWLSDNNGALAKELMKNNYFVSDTNYGWGPDSVGDRTDIINWPEWFCEEKSAKILKALFSENGMNSPYARDLKEPDGENQIIMFKSCFPNSNIEGTPNDPPSSGGDGELTVANAKGVYNRLLAFFAARQDKFFVVVTAPPVSDSNLAKNARAFNNWLVYEWLKNYKFKNVFVFDFYNVLTSKNSHHRLKNGKIEHVSEKGKNTLCYPAASGDDHPSKKGNCKATEEFVPLLNHFCGIWLASNPPQISDGKCFAEGESAKRAEEENKTVLPPPVINPDNRISSPDGMIDDFKGPISGWQIFKDDGKAGTSLEFKAADNAAGMQIKFNLPRESWASCAKVFSKPQDWHRWKTVSLKAEGQGELTIFIYEVGKGDGDLLIFEKTIDLSGRKNGDAPILIPLSEFKQPDWQGDTNAKFNAKIAKGVAFHMSSGQNPRKDDFVIREIKLIK